MYSLIRSSQKIAAGSSTTIHTFTICVLLFVVGCETDQGPTTVPVRGLVVFEGADPSILVGQKIEFAQAEDPTVRAFAEIQPDGTFDLATLHEGKLWPGAWEGSYLVRLVLADDDLERQKTILKQIDPDVLSYSKSPWRVTVPGSQPLVIAVKRR